MYKRRRGSCDPPLRAARAACGQAASASVLLAFVFEQGFLTRLLNTPRVPPASRTTRHSIPNRPRRFRNGGEGIRTPVMDTVLAAIHSTIFIYAGSAITLSSYASVHMGRGTNTGASHLSSHAHHPPAHSARNRRICPSSVLGLVCTMCHR